MRVQARQLLTDPAVAREFERLRGVAEAKAQEVRKLQEELQAVNFSQDSKAGRLLMAKCRALQVHCSPHIPCSTLLWGPYRHVDSLSQRGLCPVWHQVHGCG